ncbi:MAG: tyrosine-type recombinase/integrase, partial [Candidatus Bipolaricaulia bacterium]
MSAKDRKALVRYDLYLQRKNAPLTRLNKLRQLRRFLLFLPPSKRENLADIAPADIDAFIHWGQDQGYAPATINGYLSTLYDCFGYLQEQEDDALHRNPVKPRQHYLPSPLRLPRPMERADINRLFSVVERSRDRAIFLVALCCGLRVSEVAHLKLSDVDFERHTLRVNHGKGGVDRVVYLTPEVEESLRAWLSERISSSSNNYLFCSAKSRNRTQPISRSRLWQLLKEYLQKADIDRTQYSLKMRSTHLLHPLLHRRELHSAS